MMTKMHSIKSTEKCTHTTEDEIFDIIIKDSVLIIKTESLITKNQNMIALNKNQLRFLKSVLTIYKGD